MIRSDFKTEVATLGLTVVDNVDDTTVYNPNSEAKLITVYNSTQYTFVTYPELETIARSDDLYALACDLAGTPLHERGGTVYVVKMNDDLYLQGENSAVTTLRAARQFLDQSAAEEIAQTLPGCWVEPVEI